jgi:glutamine synthetase
MTLDPKALEEQIRAGEVDTVLVVFPDLQGRLMGKRVTGHFFLDQVLGDGIEACNYLLALDVDMDPLPGYRFASWEQGYGDVKARPDLATLRRVPWLDATALVLCDVVDPDAGEPVEVSPRRVLQRQVERAAARGYADLTPHSTVIEDYHILQTTRDEYLIRQIRNGMDGAGVPVEFSKGEAGRGQHEINLRYADPVEMADRHTIYKNGAKEIAALNDRSITFMAKYSMDETGNSCHLHSSLWSADGGEPLDHDHDAPDHLSEPFRHYLGGLLATARELSYCFAPYVNSYKRYQPGSWAPTAIVWGRDNRTCGMRIVGHGPSLRVESRIPGGDCNAYLAFAATIAGGLHGIEHGLDIPPPFEGNAYEADDVPRVPATLVEAIEELERSEVAAKAFGEDVHFHLVNTAKQEWASFNRVVTDWERRRNFEQL